jgi:cell division protein FtsW (lipid II flippase)
MTTSAQPAGGVTGQVPLGDATYAAGALLSTSALLTFVVGLFAVTANKVEVSGPGYQYTFQIAGWGWANMLTGLILAAFALALFASATWARAAATVATCLAIVVTFLWMPYYPIGAAVLIALDVVVVWALATWNTSRESV